MITNQGFTSVFAVARQLHFRWQEVKKGGSVATKPLNLDPSIRPRRQDWDGELCDTRATIERGLKVTGIKAHSHKAFQDKSAGLGSVFPFQSL
uniref:Uncharacterized protein n=1 Tax=Hucho hucho TaxID=62062 RepID=A0A4W5RRS4_9TELE